MILDLSTPGGINSEIIAERARRPAHERRKSVPTSFASAKIAL
jgi:hypothetical protein